MKLALISVLMLFVSSAEILAASNGPVVYIIPVRENVATPLEYLVRRGVKEAMEAKAEALILDMETNGGLLDSTESIIAAINQFKGKTVTYVNRKAFSAGAFIAFSTQEIYMAPQSVIGAAAPILMAPGGGVEAMPESVEAKMTSGVRALVRTSAEKNGYNVEVVEAMIDRTRELKIDGEVLNEKGQILTLTNVQAEREYGDPPQPLLSSGTVESVEDLIARLGYSHARVVRVQQTGAERLATWLTAASPLLLLLGIVGIYIEMKTPGFGIPGIAGLVAFALYFLGGYIAGLSGFEWMVVFLLGLTLLILEIFVFPGTLFLGLVGGAMMMASLVMAMVDLYPGMPRVPNLTQVRDPLFQVLLGATLGVITILLLSRFMLKTPLYSRLVSQTASGEQVRQRTSVMQTAMLGESGTAISTLRPGGKAQFGEKIMDVVTQGELIEKGTPVKIVGFSGREAVVERETLL